MNKYLKVNLILIAITFIMLCSCKELFHSVNEEPNEGILRIVNTSKYNVITKIKVLMWSPYEVVASEGGISQSIDFSLPVGKYRIAIDANSYNGILSDYITIIKGKTLIVQFNATTLDYSYP